VAAAKHPQLMLENAHSNYMSKMQVVGISLKKTLKAAHMKPRVRMAEWQMEGSRIAPIPLRDVTTCVADVPEMGHQRVVSPLRLFDHQTRSVSTGQHLRLFITAVKLCLSHVREHNHIHFSVGPSTRRGDERELIAEACVIGAKGVVIAVARVQPSQEGIVKGSWVEPTALHIRGTPCDRCCGTICSVHDAHITTTI
jgi:hypothetical protein